VPVQELTSKHSLCSYVYYEECTAQHKKGDAGVPDGTMNFIAYTMS